MTLILSEASWRFAIQVGDRLVTRATTRFNPIANKNVLYLAPDALVSFGYTGPAYLEGVPTDQWLVEKLTGVSYPRRDRLGALRLGPLPSWRPLGITLQSLCGQLDTTLAQDRGTQDMFFELVGTGWQWERRRRPRPILFGIVRRPRAPTTELWRAARHVGPNEFVFGATPDTNADLLNSRDLPDGLKRIRTIDEAEQLFVGGIRQVADQSCYVGRACMSVVLPPPQYRRVRIRYLALEFTEGTVRSSHQPTAEPSIGIAFSPWVVGPGTIWAPSILSGSWNLQLGDFDVRLEAPEPPPGSGMLGAASSVPRSPDPL